MKQECKLERLNGEPVVSLVTNKAWFEHELDMPEYLEIKHHKMGEHLSKVLPPGDSMIVFIQPPGFGSKVFPGIKAKYEALSTSGNCGEPSGRVDLGRVRNFIVTSRKCRVEVLSGDTVELWPTTKPDYFSMELIKEVCWVCAKETGDAANGLAYICDGCNKSVHVKCAGLKRELCDDEDFFCRRCRPTVAEDEIGDSSGVDEAGRSKPAGEVYTVALGKASAMVTSEAVPAISKLQGSSKAKNKESDTAFKKQKRKAGNGSEGDATQSKAKRTSSSKPAAAKVARGGGDAAAAGHSAAE